MNASVLTAVAARPDATHAEMANAIRFLAIDAVEQAKSGHPGMPMGMADVATVLFSRFMKFDPADPAWPDRDRFVLSAGHASMLLYSMLHLTRVQAVNAKYETVGQPSVSLDDIKKFRQWHSKCAGHPEYRWTSGVGVTPALDYTWSENNYTRLFSRFHWNNYYFDPGGSATWNQQGSDPFVPDESQARLLQSETKSYRNRDGHGEQVGLEQGYPIYPINTQLTGSALYGRYHAQGGEYSFRGAGAWLMRPVLQQLM